MIISLQDVSPEKLELFIKITRKFKLLATVEHIQPVLLHELNKRNNPTHS